MFGSGSSLSDALVVHRAMIVSDAHNLAHRCMGLDRNCFASYADELLLHIHCLAVHTLQYFGSQRWQDFNRRFPLKTSDSDTASATSSEVSFENGDLPEHRNSESTSENVCDADQNGTAAASGPDAFQEDENLSARHSNTPSSHGDPSDRESTSPCPSVGAVPPRPPSPTNVPPPPPPPPSPTSKPAPEKATEASLIEKATQGAKEFERLVSEKGLGSPSSRRIGKLRISSRSQGHKVLPNAYLDKGARAAFNKQQQPTVRAANNILKRAQRPRALSREHVRHNLATEGTIDVKVNGTLDQVVHISSSVQTENLLCDLTFKATKCAQQKAQNMIEYTSQFGGRFRGRKRLTEPTNRLPFRDEPETPARLFYSRRTSWPSFPRLRDRYDRYMDKIQVREIERRQEVWHSNLMHVVTHQTYAGEQSTTEIQNVLPHCANIVRPASEASTSDSSFSSLVTKAASKRAKNPTKHRFNTASIVESLKRFRFKLWGWRSNLVSTGWRRRRRNLSLSPSVGRSPRRSRPRERRSRRTARSPSQLNSSQESLDKTPDLNNDEDWDLRSPMVRELVREQKRKRQMQRASAVGPKRRSVESLPAHEGFDRSDSSHVFQVPAPVPRPVSEVAVSTPDAQRRSTPALREFFEVFNSDLARDAAGHAGTPELRAILSSPPRGTAPPQPLVPPASSTPVDGQYAHLQKAAAQYSQRQTSPQRPYYNRHPRISAVRPQNPPFVGSRVQQRPQQQNQVTFARPYDISHRPRAQPYPYPPPSAAAYNMSTYPPHRYGYNANNQQWIQGAFDQWKVLEAQKRAASAKYPVTNSRKNGPQTQTSTARAWLESRGFGNR